MLLQSLEMTDYRIDHLTLVWCTE